MSFEGVREFINSGIGAVGTITLADLRKQIRGDAAAMAEVKAEVLKGREKELLASLRDLKAKHSRIMVKRMEEESRVKEMIGDLDTQRSNEIRARIERERVKDALKRIDQANLQALEIEKRAEIDELTKEQELLKKKEAEALAEIDRLVKLIASNNANVISVPTEATTATRQGTIGERPLAPDDIRKKFATSGRQLGEDAAAMRLSRERMLKEREAIVAKLADIANQKNAGTGRKPTDPATGVKLDDHQRRALIDKLKTNQVRLWMPLCWAQRLTVNLLGERERSIGGTSRQTELGSRRTGAGPVEPGHGNEPITRGFGCRRPDGHGSFCLRPFVTSPWQWSHRTRQCRPGDADVVRSGNGSRSIIADQNSNGSGTICLGRASSTTTGPYQVTEFGPASATADSARRNVQRRSACCDE